MTNRTTQAIGGLLSATFLLPTLLLPTWGAAADRKYIFGQNELVVDKVGGLRRQIARCWKLSAITQRENFNVHIRVKLRPNGTVLTARVVDYAWIVGDPYRFSVAKSARQAILSRRCNPLLIPKERRQRKKQIILTLNPKDIFRRK